MELLLLRCRPGANSERQRGGFQTVVFNKYTRLQPCHCLNMDRYRLRPRMLRDVSQLDMRVELFGEWVEFPVCVAPTARHDYAHPDGEIATARGKSA